MIRPRSGLSSINKERTTSNWLSVKLRGETPKIEAIEVTKESQAEPQRKRDKDKKQIEKNQNAPSDSDRVKSHLNPQTETGWIKRRIDQ